MNHPMSDSSPTDCSKQHHIEMKTVVVGAGPVGALAALYAAVRGDDVELYELRSGAYPRYRSEAPPLDPSTTGYPDD